MQRQLKDSGIAWVGEIPQEWQTMPLYCLYSERKNINIFGNEQNLLSLSYGKIIRKDINTSGGLLPANYNGYNIIEANDIVIRSTDLQNDKRSLRTGLAKERGIITSAYIALKPKQGVNSRFFHYLLHSYDISKVFYNMGNGVRQGLNYDEFAKLFVLVPSVSEQQRIADFLDRECEKIDELKADIQAQIDTLEQYKRSVITEAVTHGLNLDATMKNSGLGWMPVVPKHWRVEKLKYNLCQRGVKNRIDKQVLSLYREYGIVPKDSRDDNHNVTSQDVSDYKYVRVGDFVVNKMKAWQGSVAVSNYEGIVSPAYFVYEFTNKNIDGKYFHYLIRNKTYTAEFRRLSGGIREGQWDLPADALNNTYILIPPLEEQKAVAEYLDKKCAEIEQVIADKKVQLETLDEYKKSLIYEYVTGKKEVV